jgi:hypothetical protein
MKKMQRRQLRRLSEMEGQGRAQFWDNLLKDRAVELQVEELEELGKGKRSRKQVGTSFAALQ